MAFTNSSLATYINTNHKHYSVVSDRKIDKIILHHMAAVWTGKQCADYFATTDRQVSSTYCIGYAGDIAVNVEEKYRPWTSGSLKADGNAVTIEVSDADNSYTTITDASMTALIKLIADIAKRNNLGKLVKGTNVYGHKDWASTSCPCYYDKIEYICEEANKINYPETQTATETKEEKSTATNNIIYTVQTGAFKSKENAENYAKTLKEKGIECFVAVKGDVDGDGSITVADAREILKKAVGTE